MAHILITTTPTIANAKVLEYYGIITTNVVIGVNFFSDFMASFSDIFGGNSSTYQRKLDSIYQEVITGLENKAMRLKANAIIGLRIDFDEISGKGKQMFMATAVGTACRIEYMNGEEKHDKYTTNEVSNDIVEKLCKSRSIQLKLQEKGWIPGTKTWEYILSHNMPELAIPLAAHFFTVLEQPSRDEYLENLKLYFSSLDYEEIVQAVYPLLEEHQQIILPIIKKQNLFHPQHTLSFIEKGNLPIVISLLQTSKEQYSISDLTLMEEILEKLDNLPNKGKIETVVSGLFNKKEEQMYICPKGHKNNKNSLFCEKFDCGLNIKGLTQEDVEVIEQFRAKVTALKDLLA